MVAQGVRVVGWQDLDVVVRGEVLFLGPKLEVGSGKRDVAAHWVWPERGNRQLGEYNLSAWCGPHILDCSLPQLVDE